MWEPSRFLVDTGADCTVFNASTLNALCLEGNPSGRGLSGVGGATDSVTIMTALRMPRKGGGFATFRGEYSAFTELESLDMCVLGRDILDMFASIFDRSNSLVALLRAPHRYAIDGKSHEIVS